MSKAAKGNWMGPSAYAKHRGVNLSAVKRWIKEGKLEGCIKQGSNGRKKIDQETADLLIDGPKDGESASSIPGVTNVSHLTKARTAKTAMEAKAAQLKYEKMAGNLVEKSEVISVASEMAAVTKEALLTIPDRIAPILAAESEITSINLILTDAIEEALRNLASERWDFFRGDKDDIE